MQIQIGCLITINVSVRNNFNVDNIHYKGQWKGWAFEIDSFLGPEMATSKASAIWVPKSRELSHLITSIMVEIMYEVSTRRCKISVFHSCFFHVVSS
jgi:hypothetical protein